jgi:hypothetical protein
MMLWQFYGLISSDRFAVGNLASFISATSPLSFGHLPVKDTMAWSLWRTLKGFVQTANQPEPKRFVIVLHM